MVLERRRGTHDRVHHRDRVAPPGVDRRLHLDLRGWPDLVDPGRRAAQPGADPAALPRPRGRPDHCRLRAGTARRGARRRVRAGRDRLPLAGHRRGHPRRRAPRRRRAAAPAPAARGDGPPGVPVTEARFDELIHAPTRLSIVALLAAAEWADFKFIRDNLKLSDSALSKQLSLLDEAGYVEIRKG